MLKRENNTSQPFWLRQAPITILGVLLLGIIGSSLYDLLVKPGLTNFGRFVLDAVTLGSVTVKDAAYSSAAMNPTPVSALVLLQAGLFLTTLPALSILGRTIARRETNTIEFKLEKAYEEERKEKILEEMNKLTKKLRKLRLAFWLLFVPWFFALAIGFSVHNQSVLVWRAFNVNLAILGSQITTDERLMLQSQFAKMNTGDDYKKIREHMSKLADSRGVKLKTIETW